MTTELEYIGDTMPKWFKAGVRLKVKSTPHLRKYGVRAADYLNRPGNNAAWPGYVFKVEKRIVEGVDGWWEWRLEGDDERPETIGLYIAAVRLADLEDFVRLPKGK